MKAVETLLTIATEYGIYAAFAVYLLWERKDTAKRMWERADKREEELMNFINNMKDEMKSISNALIRVEHNVNEIRNERNKK